MTAKEVALIYEAYGLEYAIQYSVSPENIEDAQLSSRWAFAKLILNEIETCLNDILATLEGEEEEELR